MDYPLELDIFDLCSEDLRKILEAPRQKLRDIEGQKLGLQPSAKSNSKGDDVTMTDAEGSSSGSGESSTGNEKGGKRVQYEDDNTSLQREDDITKLSG